MIWRGWPLGIVVPLQAPSQFSPFAPGQWQEALSEVANAGYEGVEFAIIDPTRVEKKSVKVALENKGLRFFAIATGQAAEAEGLSLSTKDDKVRERAIQRIKDHMRLAREFGALVIIGTLRGVEGDEGLLVEALRECCAFDPGVKLTLEAINRYETHLINTVFEVLRIIDRVGAENLGVHLDTFHANIEEANIKKAFEAVKGKLFHVDIADSNRWPPGYGHLNWGEVWDALEDIGYEGHLVIECFPRPSKAEVLSTRNRLVSQWRLRNEEMVSR